MDTELLMRSMLGRNLKFHKGPKLFNSLLYLNKLLYLKWNVELMVSCISFSLKNTAHMEGKNECLLGF